jgi:hypothetical protein
MMKRQEVTKAGSSPTSQKASLSRKKTSTNYSASHAISCWESRETATN